MENISNKTIYVYSLTGIVTGGCELLHQLVGFLNDHGREAYIVYEGFGLVGNKEQVLEPYKCYNIKVATSVPDAEDTIVVLDEGFLYLASQFKKATLLFWWLSVDNFFLDPIQMPFVSWFDMSQWGWKHLIHAIKVRLHYIKARITGEDGSGLPWYPIFSLKQLARGNMISAYQSEYARLFLQNNGFKNLHPLSDYINTDFLTVQDGEKCQKENIVLYNPKKGYEYTRKLIEADSSIKWVPLINMTRDEMKNTMHKAKVYVDFGNHPGKDRIPREAALCGCCVITGTRGSAENDVDIMIPAHFKFDERKTDISKIISTIHHLFDKYEMLIKEQESYRIKILKEKLTFENECMNIFGILFNGPE
jgi:hypothetical protein